ncbi:MAG: ABC transporter permease [Burkholderiaceae bacterium]|jgi:peptide/nickel transport system permease protein|nr:ABC transporter permease [Burkholderiaceae bacterium]MCU0928872.1 ABC transporter permease [Burkholderiaceae bacterium]
MIAFLLRRLLYTLPIMLGVALVCFALVHLSPGDPLVSILPPDASADLQNQLRTLYGFDRSYPEQFASWIWRALQGDLGTSIATGRSVTEEVLKAVGNTLRLAVLATLIGFVLGCLFGFVAGYFQNSWVDKAASLTSVLGVSVPHYWLGMVLVIVFAVQLNWLPPSGAGPGSSADWAWDWEHLRHMILPAVTMSVIPMGIIARTVRALVAEILAQEFIVGLRAKGLTDLGIFWHVVKNAAPTALAVMGLQLGYLLGGSILIETVFSWPGTGFLLNSAIFQRDLPLLQGTILVLATFFVLLNLVVDIVQTLLDPRIARA